MEYLVDPDERHNKALGGKLGITGSPAAPIRREEVVDFGPKCGAGIGEEIQVAAALGRFSQVPRNSLPGNQQS